ncbi:RecQ Superfamily II DNA helicase [Pyrenophora tritici-repentis]|nr:RecQ Superfamily II DNA helicase [Pyrenophora tritici-repentis]
MAQFRGMLMFSSKAAPVPAVPWESIRDNPTDERPGWNFLKDHRTNMPVNGERWLFERVGESASIRSRFMKPGTQSGVDRQAIERYMDRVVEFREKLAVLMHITGGQPARGPELLSGYKVSGDVKIIHRYLPREVGELVVWYMWLVLPFQQRLEALVWEKEAVSSHMWPADPSGRKWTTDRLREALKRESRIAMGQEWTFAGYREMAIGISRRFCADEGEENKEWAEEQAGDSIADEQAGHTSHVAGLVYARGIMEQSGAVADRRQQFRASSTDWHRFWASRQAWTTREEAASGRERRLRARQTRQGGSLKRMMGEEAKFRGAGGSDQSHHSRRESRSSGDADGGRQELVVHVAGVGRAGRHDGGGSAVDRVAWRHGTAVQARDIVRRVAESASARRSSGGVSDARVGSWREFATFLNRLRATRQLDRIIIDECHIVLNRQYTFRKQMQQLGKLVAVETQMVMLTATLPPSEEDELFRRMHFERGQVRMFRAPTARSNIAYRVVRVEKERKRQEVEATVLAMVQQKVRKYKSGKIVVYGNSVPKVKG